ncbi:MAG: GtrA family protein [Lachnospiraceae bacterium]|nr:GtrA family protein [Lachnospiraceae bacterium]
MKSGNLWQFVKFGLVGVSNTLISEGLYVIIVYFGGNYLFASLVGFIVSVLNAYFWNNRYVFKEEGDGEKRVWWKVLLKTYAAYLGGYLVTVGLLVLWVDIVQISRFMGGVADWCRSLGLRRLTAESLGEIVAAGVNLLLTVPLNYVVNKYWAFRK